MSTKAIISGPIRSVENKFHSQCSTLIIDPPHPIKHGKPITRTELSEIRSIKIGFCYLAGHYLQWIMSLGKYNADTSFI